jgi:hypothetical protein
MIDAVSFGTILIPCVILVFAVALYKVQVQTRRDGPLRKEVLSESILYRSSFPMKVKMASHWSTKTLGGMELIVTKSGAGMTLRVRGLSDVIGTQYWARSSDLHVRIEHIVRLPLSVGTDWVVLSSRTPNTSFDVAVLARDDQSTVIQALRDAGASFPEDDTPMP